MKSIFRKYILDLFINRRLFIAGMICFLLFMSAYFFEEIYILAVICLWIFLGLVLTDYLVLFSSARIVAKRQMHTRMSNGDFNKVGISVKNLSPFTVKLELIDELPVQYQERDFKIVTILKKKEKKQLEYSLRPVERGDYQFGNLHIFISTRLGLLSRRKIIAAEEFVEVYPSFVQLRNYQLMASNTVGETGTKRIRRLGSSFEFEQVKDYRMGDDFRKMNWKATARRGMMMVNQYVDEKSQQIFLVIDKGRLMKMPFNGLSLLDYSINSALVLSYVCLQKQDRVGLLTFADKMGDIIPAERKMTQRETILRALYGQQTTFLESDFEMLYLQVRAKIKQRSLLILYTNFESVTGLSRQIPYLRSLAKHHLLLVVFFENSELKELASADAENIEDVYVKTIAGKFTFEKRRIVKELQQYGILSLLTTPEQLTINAINKYLELKSRQLI